jgi:hypothetical protein
MKGNFKAPRIFGAKKWRQKNGAKKKSAKKMAPRIFGAKKMARKKWRELKKASA